MERTLCGVLRGLVVTSIPRQASACFNSRIALSAVAELLACSMWRSSAFRAGSLSLITHLRANILASCKLAIGRLGWRRQNWHRNNRSGAETSDHLRFETATVEQQTEDCNRVAVMTPATFQLFFSAIDCPACKKESRREPPRLIALGGLQWRGRKMQKGAT